LLAADLKIILLNHQNNFVGTLKIMINAIKNFNILATSLSVYIIILIIQQIYFSDLYSAKILDLSAKPFFPCILVFSILMQLTRIEGKDTYLYYKSDIIFTEIRY